MRPRALLGVDPVLVDLVRVGARVRSRVKVRSRVRLGLGLGLGLDEVLVDRVLVRDLRVELSQQPVHLVRVRVRG